MNIQPNNLYVGDALKALKAMQEGSVDLIFTDPPYNLNYGYDLHDDAMPEEAYLAWCYQYPNGSKPPCHPLCTGYV